MSDNKSFPGPDEICVNCGKTAERHSDYGDCGRGVPDTKFKAEPLPTGPWNNEDIVGVILTYDKAGNEYDRNIVYENLLSIVQKALRDSERYRQRWERLATILHERLWLLEKEQALHATNVLNESIDELLRLINKMKELEKEG